MNGYYYAKNGNHGAFGLLRTQPAGKKSGWRITRRIVQNQLFRTKKL